MLGNMSENRSGDTASPDVQATIQELFSQVFNNAKKGSHAPPSDKTHLLQEDQVSVNVSSSSSSNSSESSEYEVVQEGDEEAERPRQVRHNEPRNVSNTGTIVHFLKANISTGLLAMPKAISNFGMLGGVMGILLIGSIFILSIHLLFDISKGIARRIKLDQDLVKLKNIEQFLKHLIEKSRKKAKKEAKRKAKEENKNSEGWKVRFKKDFEVGNSSKQQPDSSFEECKAEAENSQPKSADAEASEAANTASTVPVELLNLGGDEAALIAQIQQLFMDQNEEEVDKIQKTLHYPQIVEWSFRLGQKELRWATKLFKYYVKLMLIATHIGCCCVCFLFIAECLSEMPTTSKYFTHSGSFILLAYALPIMICLSFIPDRHELTGVATIAFLLQIIGVGLMFYFFLSGRHSKNYHPYFAPADSWSLYFGILFYAFEGTGITLHLESHMENRRSSRGATGVFNKAMVFMVFLFAFFGLFGYWKYGNDVKTSVSFNLPEGRLGDLAQFMTALGVLLTYPFHFSFVLTPFKTLVLNHGCSDHHQQILDLVLRTVLVVFTYFISAIIPYLELQISVLGATASCFLVLIVPSLMYINTFGALPGVEYTSGRLLFFFLVFLIGNAGTMLGAYMTIKNLPLYYPNGAIFG